MSEAEHQAALLELLYLCPVAILKCDASGAIGLMNPLGVQLLMPLAAGGGFDNFYDVLANHAPEIREMANRFKPSVGRICDEYRVFVDIPVGGTTRSMILSITMHKVDADILVAVIADVTSAALRERVIRVNEARLHAVFDGVKDYGICTIDIDGMITSWNRSAERMEGYRSDEAIGMSADLLLASSGARRESIAPLLDIARRDGWHEYEAWRIRKDGSRYWANSTISVLRDKSDEALIGYSVVTRDLTKRKRSEDQLHVMATTDPLTGAHNRRSFFEAAVRAETHWRDERVDASLLMLDLDHFKSVNDEFGHDAGDEVLRHFVGIIHGEIRAADVIGRQGGEEFLVLLDGIGIAAALNVAGRIRDRLAATPLMYEQHAIDVTVSIGVAQLGLHAPDMPSLIRAADDAVYVAKSNGRNRIEQATVEKQKHAAD